MPSKADVKAWKAQFMGFHRILNLIKFRISKTSFVDTLFLVPGVFQAYADEV